jgi:hypothetical protein
MNMNDPNPYRVHTHRSFWLWRGLGAAAFAVACVLAMRSGGALVTVLGALGAAMFGFFAAYALRQLLRRGPRLTLGPEGVDVADLRVGTIAWTEIEGVEAFGSHEAPFIAFHVRDPAPWLARMPPWSRLVARWLRASGLPLFSVNLIGVDRDVGEIASRAIDWHRRSLP